ncbi:hypothetical protein [Sphingobium sp. CFD-2]|uniref:hypothetical protein n=1 Tax=Sphingobium sp. CFD-2 TaxID=2878542 RepID=UPI00214AEDFC|nr:hypothetical protein [Sphingobium sp. CFD-2]
MPLWLDLLRTPMAATETARLRWLRMSWQLSCLATALCVAFIRPMRAVIGQAAPCLAAGIIAITVIQSLLYWTAKQRADNHAGEPGETPE